MKPQIIMIQDRSHHGVEDGLAFGVFSYGEKYLGKNFDIHGGLDLISTS